MNATNCVFCGGPIKRQKDGKKFCGATCRSVYHYKMRVASEPERGMSDDPMQFDRKRALSAFLAKLQASGQRHE